MSKVFSPALLKRISALAAIAEEESAEAGTLSALFVILGLDAPVAGDQEQQPQGTVLHTLHSRRAQAFALIVQHLADNYGFGEIEGLLDAKLLSLIHEAMDLVHRWDEDAPIEGWDAKSEIQRLLAVHYEIGAEIALAEEEAAEEEEMVDAERIYEELENTTNSLRGRPDLVEYALEEYTQLQAAGLRARAAHGDDLLKVMDELGRHHQNWVAAFAAMDEAMRDEYTRRFDERYPGVKKRPRRRPKKHRKR